jgi:intracellular protein transport protein USO1
VYVAENPPTPLVLSLVAAPDSASLDPATTISTVIATLLFSHLLRTSPRSKSLALAIKPTVPPSDASGGGNFFVPADVPGGAPTPPPEPEPEEEDEPQTVIQMLSENLSLSFLSRARVNTSDREAREWDRLIVSYLSLLAQWLWDEPGSVRAFLDAGGMGVVSGHHILFI